MRKFLPMLAMLPGIISCSIAGSTTQEDTNNWPDVAEVSKIIPVDTPKSKELKPYTNLRFTKEENLKTASGTKSVLFNSSGSTLFALNLEGLNIYEIDRSTRSVTKVYKFKPTPGTGWDYKTSSAITSYQEKPVEGCLSHKDSVLWVSLHNAEGIVPIWVLNSANNRSLPDKNGKLLTIINKIDNRTDSVYVPLIKTGKTPKVINVTSDDRYLVVSNWHSKSASILEMNSNVYPFGNVIHTIPVQAIPRGIAIDEKNQKTYIALMGGSQLVVVDNNSWKAVDQIVVNASPRHVVLDQKGRLFVSYNSLAQIACIDASSGKTLFSAQTHAQPRTIALSKNQQFVFVTCYSSNFVDVYKINEDNFSKVASLPSKGNPVGVDIFEDDDKLEAWVCNYQGTINIFSFTKDREP